MIRELIEVQISILKAQLSQKDLDLEEFEERAETLLLYARCLRDYPHLPLALSSASLASAYPTPPPYLEEALNEAGLDASSALQNPEVDEESNL